MRRQGGPRGGGGTEVVEGWGCPARVRTRPSPQERPREGPGQVRGRTGRLSVSNPTESLKSGQGGEVGHREGSSKREEGWK